MEMVEQKRRVINGLVEQKSILYNKLSDLDMVRNKIEVYIHKINRFMYDYCDHEWEYCRESSYDRSDHLCKTCRQLQSDDPES